MDRYQIYEQTEKANHAGSKAVLDILFNRKRDYV